jgi:hypothetical protein
VSEVTFLSVRDGDVWWHSITAASPYVWVSGELLRPATRPERLSQSASPPDHYIDPTWHENMSDLFAVTFRDDFGREFIYRAVRYDHAHDRWYLEWPD